MASTGGVRSAYRDNAEVLSLMLSKSGDANVVNFKLRSVLHVAVYEESLQCVDVLLQHSASTTAQVGSQTYLLKKGKGSPYSIAERRVPELIPVVLAVSLQVM